MQAELLSAMTIQENHTSSDHHGTSLMLQEIHQQPEVLARMLDQDVSALGSLQKRFSRKPPKFIVLVARGTSSNASQFARYLFQIVLGIPTFNAAPSVSTLYESIPKLKNALVIGISQSGESTDINAFLEDAHSEGAFTICITNEADSSIINLVHEALFVQAGRETSVAATKTYSGQLLMLYYLARALGANFPDWVLKTLPDLTALQLQEEERIYQLAERYRYMSHTVVIGRGLNYANAFEFALKMMETSYVVAAGFSGADFAHGPIALVDRGFPIFLYIHAGPTFEQTVKQSERLNQIKAEVIAIGQPTQLKAVQWTRKMELKGEFPILSDYPEDLFTPIPSIIPAQLFAAFLADCKGLNPDTPRLLTKITRTL